MDRAMYIPPDPVHVESLLENWAAFIKRNDIHPLLQAAIMHAQFEMIHPFLDGNGRTGRLIISLFFVEKNIISKPCFYLSTYLQNHRDEYYSNLSYISSKNEWMPWISFFLHAIEEKSKENIYLLTRMNELYERCKSCFPSICCSQYSINILDYLFSKPICTISDMLMEKGYTLNRQTAVTIFNKLEKAGIIQKIASGTGRRPAVWKFLELVEILENKNSSL